MNTMVTETPPESPVTPTAQVDDVTRATGIEVNTTSMNQTPSVDAEKVNPEQLMAEYNKLQTDLNRMKSSFQRNEAERENQWKAREEEYKRQVEALKISTMDDEQRKAYEADSYKRRYEEMQLKVQELEQRSLAAETSMQAYNYFLAQGVPASAIKLDEGYDELWNSGMEYITSELQRLKTSPAAAPSAPTPKQEAPPVVTAAGTPSFGGPTWAELVKTYGDEETVYRLVETGQLPANVIPVPPQFRK